MELYCVTFYDEEGDLFDKEIQAENEDHLQIILEAHENDVVDYQLIKEEN